MSSPAVDWAWTFEPDDGTLTSGERLTLLAFAWESDNQGVTWVGPRKLMERAHMQKAGLRKCIAKLAATGALTRFRRMRGNGSEGSAFTVLHMPRHEPLDFGHYEFTIGELIEGPATGSFAGFVAGGIPADTPLPADTQGGIPPDTGNRSTTRKHKRATPSNACSRETREAELTAGTLAISYRGRKVPFARAGVAAQLLDAYNAESGQRRQRFNPDGSVSEDFKRVVGAVVNHPDVEATTWHRMLNTVLANPWWDGPASVGVIFGPKVVDDNLDSPARGASRRRPRESGVRSTIAPEIAAMSADERAARLAADIKAMSEVETG